jgi:hypothetical protein
MGLSSLQYGHFPSWIFVSSDTYSLEPAGLYAYYEYGLAYSTVDHTLGHSTRILLEGHLYMDLYLLSCSNITNTYYIFWLNSCADIINISILALLTATSLLSILHPLRIFDFVCSIDSNPLYRHLISRNIFALCT